MYSFENQNLSRRGPRKGAPSLFSKWTRYALIVVLIILMIGISRGKFSFVPAQGANPTFSVSVTIIDYAFQPAKINITTGTTVVWTYSSTGKDLHTVTSNPGTNKTQNGNPLLNSGSMSPGQTFSYTFTQPGHYPYQCSFHPTIMNASVNVTGAPSTPPPSTQSPPDYTFIAIAGGVVGVVVVATLALFLRRKRRTPTTPSSS